MFYRGNQYEPKKEFVLAPYAIFSSYTYHTGQSIRCTAGVYADLPGIDTLICGIKWRPTINKLRKWYVLSYFFSVIVYSKTSRMPKGL